MYQSPKITSYTGPQLMDLIGPVETNYCEISNANVAPPFFLQGKDDVTISFDFAECPDFDTVSLRLINAAGQTLTSDTFVLADGTVSGSVWTLDYDFGFAPDPGTYQVEIIATDSNNCSSTPQFVSFVVLGVNGGNNG